MDSRPVPHGHDPIPIRPSETNLPTDDKNGEVYERSTPMDELKKEPGVSTTYIPSSADSRTSQEGFSPNGKTWETTFLRYGPLGGIACMLLAVASIVVSLGVLLGSNGKAESEWGATPSTILAICTAVANQSLRFAAFQGFGVMWWFSASRGTSISQLHMNWRAGTTFGGALMAGRRMGLIGLACIVSTLVAVDGPLLQKATSVVEAPTLNTPVILNVSMSPEVPHTYTGGWLRMNVTQSTNMLFNQTMPTANGDIPNDVSPYFNLDVFSDVWLKPWAKDRTVPGTIKGCDEICTTTILAPALAQTVCDRREIPVNFSRPGGVEVMLNPSLAPPLEHIGFMVSGNLVLGERETLTLITAYSDVTTGDCVGNMYMDICTLESAIGEYKVTVNDGEVILHDELPRVIALANNTQVDRQFDPDRGYYPSTLGGVWAYFSLRYQSLVAWYQYQGSVVGQQQGPMTPESYAQLEGADPNGCHS